MTKSRRQESANREESRYDREKKTDWWRAQARTEDGEMTGLVKAYKQSSGAISRMQKLNTTQVENSKRSGGRQYQSELIGEQKDK